MVFLRPAAVLPIAESKEFKRQNAIIKAELPQSFGPWNELFNEKKRLSEELHAMQVSLPDTFQFILPWEKQHWQVIRERIERTRNLISDLDEKIRQLNEPPNHPDLRTRALSLADDIAKFIKECGSDPAILPDPPPPEMTLDDILAYHAEESEVWHRKIRDGYVMQFQERLRKVVHDLLIQHGFYKEKLDLLVPFQHVSPDDVAYIEQTLRALACKIKYD